MRSARLSFKHHRPWRQSQQGQIILVTVLLLGIIITISLFSLIRPGSVNLEDVAQTERALAQAKEALIAYASGRPATNRPGELPCPDTNNNGSAEPNCSTLATQIGRLPWATLGIPDLRDGSGERLWYAVSNNFKNSPAVTPLNSNISGQLTVTGIAPANNVIAIVFAPGTVVAGQSRTAANTNNVAHYLEGENANGDTIFTSAASSGTFNDRLLAITSALFFPAVEMKVARDLRSTLNTYYGVNFYFPPANAYSAGCIAANQGMIPADPSTCGAGHLTFAPPPWFGPDQWYQIIFYAVAPACVNPAALNCTGAGGFLTVNGVGGVRALFITPGMPYAGQARPCANITDCLELPNTTSFPSFTHATGLATTNDRVVIVAP